MNFIKLMASLAWGFTIGATGAIIFWVLFITLVFSTIVMCSSETSAASAVPIREATIGEQDRSVLGIDQNTPHETGFLDSYETRYSGVGMTNDMVLEQVCISYCTNEIDRRIEAEMGKLREEVEFLYGIIEIIERKQRDKP